jgi:hypothetical protein
MTIPAPNDMGGARSAQISVNRPLAQPQALGNRPLRQLVGTPQSQNFADLAHRQSLAWHPVPLLLSKKTRLPSVENCRRRDRYALSATLITIAGIGDHDQILHRKGM